MKCGLFFYQLIIFIFLCSCSNNKHAKTTHTLNHQTIDLGENYIGYGGFLTCCQDVIIGLEMSPSMCLSLEKVDSQKS